MKRIPPRVAVWCLTHLVRGERGQAILGDLLERFEEGETRAWFWRQTLATLAYGFARGVRDHGPTFAAALIATTVLFFVMRIVNSYVTGKIIDFQSHGMLELDPQWSQRWGWRIALTIIGQLQTMSWFAVMGWLVTRIHRAQPRLIVVVSALVATALHLPVTIRLAHGLLTHRRFLEYFIWDLVHLCLATGVLVVCGIWGSRAAAASQRTDDISKEKLN